MMYDVAVVGGGVIGCAVLRELTTRGYKCILLEKNQDLVAGASSGNSGIVHCGFDTELGTQEAGCIQRARQMRTEYQKLGIPYKAVGGIMVAWDKEQMDKLSNIIQKSHQLGVTNVKWMKLDELRQREPHLSTGVIGAIEIPEEAVVDPWLTPVTLGHTALRQGAEIKYNCEVTGGMPSADGSWTLQTNQGPVKTKIVINAAGLYGDRVENICHNNSFGIRPRKGQYIVYGPEAGALVNSLILPVPTEKTKGVIIFPTVYGNLVVGPTAEDVTDRENRETDKTTVAQLLEYSRKIIPRLADHQIVVTYAGIRPATETKDYHLFADEKRNWVTVGGIRSTGLSACMAIAERVHTMLVKQLQATPSNSRKTSETKMIPRMVSKGTVVMDGVEYNVTHPIAKLGYANIKSKL